MTMELMWSVEFAQFLFVCPGAMAEYMKFPAGAINFKVRVTHAMDGNYVHQTLRCSLHSVHPSHWDKLRVQSIWSDAQKFHALEHVPNKRRCIHYEEHGTLHVCGQSH